MSDVVSAFLDAIRAAGISPPSEIRADGRLHRYRLEEDRKDQLTGWYVLHLDEPASGAFGSWRTGERHTWTAKVERRLSPEERRTIEARIAADRAARDAEEAELRRAAAGKARYLWNLARRDVPAAHPYLLRTIISARGPARLGSGGANRANRA